MMTHPPIAKWRIDAALVPLAGGHRNAVLRTVGLQRNVVFKSTMRSRAAIEWLAAVQDTARRCGFVVPQMIRSASGRVVEDGWTCEDFIDGPHVTEDAMPTILPLVARFHNATADLVQRPGFLSSADLVTQSVGGDVDLDAMPPDLPDLVVRCRAAWQAMQGRQISVIHGDLNPANLIKCGDDHIALIDWDEARRDYCFHDVGALQDGDEGVRRARLAWEVACSWQIEPDHARRVAQRL